MTCCRLASLLVLLLVVGCGGNGVSMGQVTGSVTLDGKPIEQAVIRFTSPTARSTRGKVINGQITELTTFAIDDGVPVGSHTVTVQEVFSPFNDMSAAGNQGPLRPVTPIPAKYSSLGSSGLSAEIEPGDNVVKFELFSK